jgi:hypothetical protein
MKIAFSIVCFALLCGLTGSVSAPSSSTNEPENNPEMVIVAYSTYAPDDAMLWGSTSSHNSKQTEATKMVAVGQGIKLFDDPPENTRGWMYRFRQVVKGIMAEYDAREHQDFLVVVGDAFDTYITKSSSDNTVDLIKDRFLNDFVNSSIVFSSQIYCCNPWNLHDVGRAAWDEHYDAVGGPETIYKHLNAGMFMGYASAIIDMANDLSVFQTDYKRPEEFDKLLADKGASNVHMFDVDVDDDEWQLSIWYLKEQRKSHPRATLDVHQHLFTTTGTFRASHRDGGFLIFSQDDFYNMIGTLPEQFDKSRLDEVSFCPYSFDSVSQSWRNTITQRNPLVFHFAGNDWVCACNILTHDQFDKPNKFERQCPEEAPFWNGHIHEGVNDVSKSSDPREQIVLKIVPKEDTAVNRELHKDENRQKKKVRSNRNMQRPSKSGYGTPRLLIDDDKNEKNDHLSTGDGTDVRQLMNGRPSKAGSARSGHGKTNSNEKPASGYGSVRQLRQLMKGRPSQAENPPAASGYGNPFRGYRGKRQLMKRGYGKPSNEYRGKRQLMKRRPIQTISKLSPTGYGNPMGHKGSRRLNSAENGDEVDTSDEFQNWSEKYEVVEYSYSDV